MRLIDVEWDGEANSEKLSVGVEIFALDRTRLLRDVATTLGELRVNIVGCETLTGGDGVAGMKFQFEISNPAQLNSVMNALQRIDSVYDVHRIVPGGNRSN